jgi:hypothetical protein
MPLVITAFGPAGMCFCSAALVRIELSLMSKKSGQTWNTRHQITIPIWGYDKEPRVNKEVNECAETVAQDHVMLIGHCKM